MMSEHSNLILSKIFENYLIYKSVSGYFVLSINLIYSIKKSKTKIYKLSIELQYYIDLSTFIGFNLSLRIRNNISVLISSLCKEIFVTS
jgi:hypothetical protein